MTDWDLTATVVRNYCFDPSWIGTGGTLVNDDGTIERSTEQVHHPGGGSLKAVKAHAGGAVDAYDSDLSRWPTVPSGTQFAFIAWVYPATIPRAYQAIVNLYKASDNSFQGDVQGDPYAVIPAGQWSLISVLGTNNEGFDCKLMPYVMTTGSDTEVGETFYTSDWRLSTGADVGWNFPARGPYIDGKYNAFLSLVQFGTDPGDELFLFYRRADFHVAPGDYGTVVALRSTDQGHTWTPDPPETIKSEANMDLRTSCAGGLTSTGRLIVPYTRYNPDTAVFQSMNYVYSDDEGDTWSAQQTISHGSETIFTVHGPMISIGDGKLLQGWYGEHSGTASTYVVTSDDDGVTWSSPVTVLTGATDEFYVTEAAYVYLGSNRIIGLVRDDIGSTYTQVKSTDNGASWTNQGTTSFDSWTIPSPPTLTYSGGLVACHYCNRAPDEYYYVVYADPTELIAGPDAWGSRIQIGEFIGSGDAGYMGVVHPFDDQRGFAAAYEGPRIDFMYSPTDEMVSGPESEYFDGRGYFSDQVWSTDSGHENVRWSGTVDDSPSDYYVNGSGVSSPADLNFVHLAGRGQ